MKRFAPKANRLDGKDFNVETYDLYLWPPVDITHEVLQSSRPPRTARLLEPVHSPQRRRAPCAPCEGPLVIQCRVQHHIRKNQCLSRGSVRTGPSQHYHLYGIPIIQMGYRSWTIDYLCNVHANDRGMYLFDECPWPQEQLFRMHGVVEPASAPNTFQIPPHEN